MISFRANSEGRIVCKSDSEDRVIELDEARALEACLQGRITECEGQESEAELRRTAMDLARAIIEAKAATPALGRRVLAH